MDQPSQAARAVRSWWAFCRRRGPSTTHLVIVGVIQILVVIVRSLAFLHLVPYGPLAWRCVAVIHGIIGIPGGPNV